MNKQLNVEIDSVLKSESKAMAAVEQKTFYEWVSEALEEKLQRSRDLLQIKTGNTQIDLSIVKDGML